MLKVEFKQVENVVLMKVLEQSDEIKLGCGRFFEHNGIKLYSTFYPEICSSSLYVKGKSKDAQDVYTSKSFNTPEEAAEYIVKFTECIDAYNESVKEKELLWKPNTGDVYYRVDNDCGYVSCLHYSLDDPYDRMRVKTFGAFKTKEQAEKVRKHSILMNLLWQLKFALCPDYEFKKGDRDNAFIKFNHLRNVFYVDHEHCWHDYMTPVFDRESCLKAVEYLNNHRELWKDLV